MGVSWLILHTCSVCIRLLQNENEELRQRLLCVTNKLEAMERELESGQDYLEMELNQNREDLEKFKDKFRRYGNFQGGGRRGSWAERHTGGGGGGAGAHLACGLPFSRLLVEA